jgi:c-di-GMP-binding flagellar brake protein YcgR
MKREILSGGAIDARGGASVAMRSRRSRRGRRVRADEIAIELLDDSGRAIAFDCFDLSAVGVYLYSDLLLSPGERVRLRLCLPTTGGKVAVEGEVVRAEAEEGVQQPGMGVAFRELEPTVQEALRSYVAERFIRHAGAR